ncbi:MAG TPA: efflux RND transporter periplasmic adaptor subunit [Phycisphaerales bacterium]|nr:efflux RND transporter periplasmic adaptor subunit [Phycisphaerales bacterium]
MDTNKVLLCLMAIVVLMGADFALANSGIGVSAITVPSADVTLSFIQPGRVAKISVKEGDKVTPGQLLMRLDDAAELARLSQIKAQSQDTTKIEGAEASLAQKENYLKKLEWAQKRGSVTELEVADAQLEVTIAKLSLRIAIFEHEQDKRSYQEAQIRVGNMSLKSPIDGTVEKIEVEVGESINGLVGTIRVVKTDPLWIDVPMPLTKAKNLKSGQTVTVNFPGLGTASQKGRIIFVATAADAASATLRVRVEVPNKSSRLSGEQVTVGF